MEGQADGNDLGQQVNGSECPVVIVDVVYVDIRVTVNRRGDSLIPSRVEDSRRQVVHTSGIWVSLGLSTEDGGIQNDVGDIIHDVFLDLDKIRFSEDDDLDRLDRLARGILEILDFRNDPNQIDVRHRFTHQTRHDLELPIDDLILKRSDQDLPPLVFVLGPTDDLRLFVTGETEDPFDGPAVVIILANRLVSLRDDTELVVLDAIVGQHENVSGDEGGNEGDEGEKTIKYDTDGLITSGLDAPGHRHVVYDQSPREVGFGWGGHVDEVDSQGVNSTYLICNTNAELLPRTLYLNSVRLYILLPSLRFVYYLYITHPGSEMARVDDRVRPRVPPAIRRCDRGGFPPSLASPGLLWVLRAPSPHQYLLGGCPLVGNSLPRVYPLSGDRPGVPPLAFRSYFLFILYNRDFIGSFEKCENKHLRNKIFKKYKALQNATRD
jgi:hypothetical protein